MEGAFLGLEEKVEISQTFQDFRNVLVMFGQAPGVDEDFIYIDKKESMKKLRSTLCMSWNTEGTVTSP